MILWGAGVPAPLSCYFLRQQRKCLFWISVLTPRKDRNGAYFPSEALSASGQMLRQLWNH